MVKRKVFFSGEQCVNAHRCTTYLDQLSIYMGIIYYIKKMCFVCVCVESNALNLIFKPISLLNNFVLQEAPSGADECNECILIL